MIPLAVPPGVAELLDHFAEWGSIVEHHLFAAPELVGVKSHSRVALAALDAQKERSRLRFIRSNAMSRLKDIWWEVYPEKIAPDQGTLWTLQQFFGPSYDFASKTLCVPAGRAIELRPDGSWLRWLVVDERGHVSPSPPEGIEWDEDEFEGYRNFSARGYIGAICGPP